MLIGKISTESGFDNVSVTFWEQVSSLNVFDGQNGFAGLNWAIRPSLSERALWNSVLRRGGDI